MFLLSDNFVYIFLLSPLQLKGGQLLYFRFFRLYLNLLAPLPIYLKATGGSGVKKTCWSYLKDSIIVVSTLLRNVTILLRSEVIGVSMCWPFDFSIVILWVIFDTFYTSFGNESWNIETNTSKFCIKVHFNGLFWMKSFDFEIFVNFGWFRQIQAKNAYFYKNAI